jgi:hypothetical protein
VPAASGGRHRPRAASGARPLTGDPSGTPIIEWELAYAAALRDAGRPADAAARLRAALGHLSAAKGPAAAQASEVSERLVDALEASGQLPAAREAMQACVEARMQLFGRHLVVAKSMTRMARLLLEGQGPGTGAVTAAHPEAAQLAQNFAASAVALAEEAAAGNGGGDGTSGSGGGLRGLLGGLFGGSRGGSAAERLSERLRAQLELGSALQALAAANDVAAGRGAGEAALRRAADVLRAAAAEGAAWLTGMDEGGADQVTATGPGSAGVRPCWAALLVFPLRCLGQPAGPQ